ncbi:hypothetical protein CJP74_06890 [Psittacicella melopsittaci]|uniref:Azaleucine resistance protein AzlC n=1 Tax=Psittacicella melopsittaci TaxID=2028576 RepID=A0A3A1XZY6_9GAMM|nr:AzlC family ABC transporter permease [Psittacicella melopsittaci]RIY31612.1 hypothetical protein CJP74_06890 [Psittacicella melopsittaci]
MKNEEKNDSGVETLLDKSRENLEQIIKTSDHVYPWPVLFNKSIPILIAFLAVGGAYGVLAVSVGMPIWFIILSSIITYSGSVQFLTIPLLASSASLSSMFITSFVVSLRFSFYIIALIPTLSKNIFRRWFESVSICDQSFAIMILEPEKAREANLLRFNLLLHAYWTIATVIGIVLGQVIGDLIPHLDFALAALFVILAYEQFKKSRSYFGLAIAVIAFIVAKLFAYNWLILAAILFCAICILGRYFFTNWSKEDI